MDFGAQANEINFKMFEQKTRARLELEQLVVQNLEYYFEYRCAIVFVTKAMMQKVGADEADFKELASIARSPIGVKIGITAKEVGAGEYKVSVRTNSGVSALNVCKFFGGGGHKMAAGFRINGDLKTVRDKILQRVYGEIVD